MVLNRVWKGFATSVTTGLWVATIVMVLVLLPPLITTPMPFGMSWQTGTDILKLCSVFVAVAALLEFITRF